MKIVQITPLNHYLYGLSNEGKLYKWQIGREERKANIGTGEPYCPKIKAGWIECVDEMNAEVQI